MIQIINICADVNVIDILIHSLTEPLTHWIINCLTDRLTHSLIQLLTHNDRHLSGTTSNVTRIPNCYHYIEADVCRWLGIFRDKSIISCFNMATQRTQKKVIIYVYCEGDDSVYPNLSTWLHINVTSLVDDYT